MTDKSGRASRLCIGCVSLIIETEIRGYSEYTPGDPASIYCRRGHWRDVYDVCGFAANMAMGGSCDDFQLAPDLAAKLPINESDYTEDDV